MLGRLFDLLEALEARGASTDTSVRDSPGRRPAGTPHSRKVDFDVQIGSLSDMTSPSSRSQSRSSPPNTAVTTHRTDDALEVVVDVAGRDPADIRVGLEAQELIVAVEDRVLASIDVPWSETKETAMINNDILTVSVEPTDAEVVS